MIVRARFRELDVPIDPREAASPEARLLALAYAVEAAVEGGRYRSLAEVAAALALSRSRLSQVMRRRWVSVEAQQQILRDRRRAPGDHCCWLRRESSAGSQSPHVSS